MTYLISREPNSDYIEHYGVLGMKWGRRKAAPMSSAYTKMKTAKGAYKQAKKAYSKSFDKSYGYSSRHMTGQFTNKKKKAESNKRWDETYKKSNQVDKAKTEYKQAKKEYKQTDEYKAKRNKAIKVGVAAVGTAVAAYGAYKMSKFVKNKNTELRMKEGKEVVEALTMSRNLKDNFFKGSLDHVNQSPIPKTAADRAKEINAIKKARDEAWNSTNRAIDTHKKLVESTINDENKHFTKAAKNVSKYYANRATDKLKKYKSKRNAAKTAAHAAVNAKRSW